MVSSWVDLGPCPFFPTNTVNTSCIHPGAHFVGSQISRCKKHAVDVSFLTVDLAAKTLCGFLKVDKANNDSETFENGGDGKAVTSFFNGEIISRLFPFITGKWGASVETDTNHWNELNVMARFPNYYRDNFDYSQLENFDHVYMRWKEKFILPDPNRTSGKKPSTGFYYICLQKSTGELTGYFHNKTERRVHRIYLMYDPQVTSTAFQIR
uniref:Vacuolar import degradation protein Vid24 n=1 Tax=Echinococcus granulosus TaxID=6210 RepID=A0A068WF84_ECHGR|nr:Vacuolar import degradation protein Vid24 [Echinococcus granulosus]